MYPRRKSLRLKGYDYASEGGYFVTICTARREHLFGDVIEEKVRLNAIGKIAHNFWADLSTYYPSLQLDSFVIMPNHMHGIVIIHADKPTQPTAPKRTLGQMMNRYKGMVTRQARVITGVSSATIWQSAFHDHIIRSERELNILRGYIHQNPALWEKDSYYDLPFSREDVLQDEL
jgi:REP element-mobilizing transposase RayT